MGSLRYEKMLFAYLVQNSEDIWVFADGYYQRFSFRKDCIRHIRAEDHLPAFAEGSCFGLSRQGYLALSQEAQRHNLTLTFYDDPAECEFWATLDQHPQLVFGQSAPAGYFYIPSAQ
jgi:hypothetical protein